MECSPRTPTPFKTSLSIQDAKYGPLKRVRVCPVQHGRVFNVCVFNVLNVCVCVDDAGPQSHGGRALGRGDQTGTSGV